MTRLAWQYRRAVWVFAFASALAVAPRVARADDEAVTRFERGVQLYEAENYEGALVEWMTAYKISKNFKLLYNIGICQNALKDYPAATESFQRYLAEGGSEVSAARKADVQDRLAKLSLMVTRVRVTTDAPAGSTVRVDDQPVGTTPLADPITVKLGRRVFSVSAKGRTASKTVDIASGGETAVVTLALGDAPATPPPPPPPKKPAADGPSFPWAAWGVTALLAGGATVTGIFALDARNDLERKQATFGVSTSSLEQQRSTAETFGLVTDVLIGAAIISGGVSTYLTIRYAGAKKKEHAFTVLPLGVGYVRSF